MTRREEVELKLERVRCWLREHDRPALLIRHRTNFAWLTAGGRSHVNTARDTGAGALLVTPERFVLLASNIEAQRLVEEELTDVPLEVWEYAWYDDAGERAGIEATISGSDPPASDVAPDVVAAMLGMRASLLAGEVRRVEQLGGVTVQVVESVCRDLHRGQTEYEVAAAIHDRALAEGARVPVCLVAADDRIATRRHPLPTDRAIRRRAMVAVCVERGGLNCSVTRLVNFEPVGDDLRRRHHAVCRVDAAAVRAARAGRPLHDVFADVVREYRRVGFPDEWMQHHQGGSTGYQPRDVIAGPHAAAVVQEQQLLAWNPSIAGTKSEDTMLATTDGFRWITEPSADWPTLEIEGKAGIVRRPDILVRN